jgi:hypothetical protein
MLAAANAQGTVALTRVVRIEHDTDSLRRTVAHGSDVWMAMRVSASHFQHPLPSHDSLPQVIVHFERAETRSGHAMTIAGYAVRPTGTYFLLHNSWGSDWGDGGYAWIHAQTLSRSIEAAYVVEAELRSAQPLATPGPTPPQSQPPTPRWTPVPRIKPPQCPGGLVVDAVTRRCTGTCPGGGPPFAGACPVAAHCAPGFVNLSGECVASPRTQHGTDPRTNTAFGCGPGGCSFNVPRGVGGCDQDWCSWSCASPRHKLTFTGGRAGCAP